MEFKGPLTRDGFHVLRDRYSPPVDSIQLAPETKRKITICHLFLNYKLSINDVDNVPVVLSLGGGGTGEAFRDLNGRVVLEITGATERTSLSLKGKGGDGRFPLGNVDVDGLRRVRELRRGRRSWARGVTKIQPGSIDTT